MKVVICTFFFATALGYNAKAQELDWVISMGGSGAEVISRSTTDNLGNIYSTGRYNGQDSDFDPGSESFLMSSIVSPLDEWGWPVISHDIFISKVSSDGSFIWAKSIGGKYDDVSTCLTIDDEGDLIVAGIYQDTIDVNPGPDDFLLAAQTNKDAFVLKLNAEGNFAWAKSFYASSGIRFNTILNLESGDLLLAGYFSGFFTIDVNGIAQSYSSGGNRDGLILVLNNFGDVISCHVISGDDDVNIRKVIKNTQNQLLFIGNFRGTADFDFSESEQFDNTNFQEAGFILKTDSDFSLIWNRVFKGYGFLNFADFCIDTDGNLYSIGYFKGIIDFDPNPNEEHIISYPPADENRSFVSKLNDSGDFVWAFSLGEGGSQSLGRNIFLDYEGNLIISGEFSGQIDFNPGSGVSLMHSVGISGGSNAFILKITNSANFVWSKKISGSSAISLAGMHASIDNGLLLSGSFVGLYNFNHPNYEFQTAIGSSDIFILKLSDLSVNVYSESVKTLKLYCWPNPVSSHLSVEIPLGYLNNELKVFDTNGKLVYSQLLLDHLSKIDMTEWNQGSYFFKLKDLSSILIKH
jgi:hypothetical protein